jgi:hypothetical protein
VRPSSGCCSRRCSLGRSTPPPASRSRRARPPPPSAGAPAPHCTSGAGRPGHGTACAPRVCPQPGRQASPRVSPAAQTVGVLQRPRLRRRAGPPHLQRHRSHSSGPLRRRPERRPERRRQPRTGQELLAAARGLSDRGQQMEAFYACLYYAALRPSEVVMLRGTRPGRRRGLACRGDRSGPGRCFMLTRQPASALQRAKITYKVPEASPVARMRSTHTAALRGRPGTCAERGLLWP